MQFEPTRLAGAYVISPQVFTDERGSFFETYHQQKFAEHGIGEEFVQDNHSVSVRNVIRGLHFQKPPHAQSKLVRVVQGEVYDVIVDLRTESETFGQWFAETLSAGNRKMLYVPTGFAHGFCVTSDTAEFAYKCGALFNKDTESGIRYDDPDLSIDWPIDIKEAIVSEKDLALKSFESMRTSILWK